MVKDPGGSGVGGSTGQDPTHLQRQQPQQQQQVRPPDEAETASIASSPNGAVVGAVAGTAGVVGVGVGIGSGGVVKGGGGVVPPVAMEPGARRGHSSAAPSLLLNGGGGVSGRALPNGLLVPGATSVTSGAGAGVLSVEEAKDGEGEPMLPPGTGVAAGAVQADVGVAAGEGSDGGDGGVGMTGAGVIGADVRRASRARSSINPFVSAKKNVLSMRWPVSVLFLSPFRLRI